ncbi:MAG: translocation/assembly module TamB domain-containing protein, partial [Ignavibacteria bacterium]|nr:translocation/assembly module TamB domain-containing protein [Ignavibacteria bacterium]
ESNNLFLKGLITSYSKTPQLDIQVDFDINDLKRREAYTMGYLSKMGGNVDGEITIKGSVDKPEIKGFVKFENVAMRVNSLNFTAKMKNEKIIFSSEGIHFDQFKIEDEYEKQLVIDGKILYHDFDDLGVDMRIRAENFVPINSTAAINPLFYGKLDVDFDVNFKGPIINPIIVADIKVNKASDLSYVLPGSELQLVSSEGIVQFIDPYQLIDSLQANSEGNYFTDSIISNLTSLNYSIKLDVDPDAKFTIHIDKKSGDYLTVGGSAQLTLKDDGTGNQSITGVYKVKSGVYQLAFYGLVKKTFMIEEGSMVSWSGKPMDAELHLSATNIVRTSSVSLVANETGSMSDSEKTIFNQRLPYEVKLNISGFLAQPDFGFNINLPEKYLAINPVVASKLAILNTEEMTSERNKQVFALLVTGSFIAENPVSSAGNSSPTSIATTAARNSVNGILADQMNKISSKFINSVDINFGLTSYEDYEDGSSDMRTELDVQVSKRLFNDRIKVEAMSSFDVSNDKTKSTNTSENTTGEYAVIYTLTPTGEYTLRLYYQNTYDLFDGEISISGIAVSFEKEFNSLKRKKKNKKTNRSADDVQLNEQGLKSESPDVKTK